MAEIKKIFDGVYAWKKFLLTENSVPGKRVYGEKLFKIGNKEYREWNPSRSKPAAAIKKGLKTFPIKQGTSILYLGAGTGTTVSHFSDIVKDGIIYAIEVSDRAYRDLVFNLKDRKNVFPLLADARRPQEYLAIVPKVDVVYCDVAQPDQVEIFLRNCEIFLKSKGYGMITIKSRSIDVTKKPAEVYAQARKKMEQAGYEFVEQVRLDPFERDHALIVIRKP